MIGSLFSSVATGFTNVVGLYVGTYFWELGSEQIALLGLSLVVSLLLAFASAAPLTTAFEKHRVAVWLSAIGILFGPLPIFLRLLGWMPPNGYPAILPILVVHGVLLTAVVITVGIVISSMIADTVDESELVTEPDPVLGGPSRSASAILIGSGRASNPGGPTSKPADRLEFVLRTLVARLSLAASAG